MRKYEQITKINGKIFTKDNIIEIFKIVEKLGDYEIAIDFNDGSSIIDSSIDILDNYFVKNKSIKSIRLGSADVYPDMIDMIQLVLYDKYGESSFSLSSCDEIKFNSIYNKFKEVLSTVKNQTLIYKLNNTAFDIVIFFTSGLILTYFQFLILGKIINYQMNSNLFLLLFAIVSLFNIKALTRIVNLFPVIEFQIGLKDKEEKRKKWLSVFINLIWPFVLSLLFFVFSR